MHYLPLDSALLHTQCGIAIQNIDLFSHKSILLDRDNRYDKQASELYLISFGYVT